MSHSTYTHRHRVDSRLLVVGSQTANLTPDPSFNHNLFCRCPNGSCEAISDIHTSRPFQQYKEHFDARCFDPCNCVISFWESRKTPKSHFRECEWRPHTSFKVGLRQLALYVICVALSVQMSMENATRPLLMKCLRRMTCSFKTPLSNRTIVLHLTIYRDYNKSSASSGVLLTKSMSRAVWMTFLKPAPSTNENGRMSHEHMLTRALVMLAESVGMLRLLAQTSKLFEEEATTTAHEQVWPLIDDVPSRELYT